MSIEEFRNQVSNLLEQFKLQEALEFIKENLAPSSPLARDYTSIKFLFSKINYEKAVGVQSAKEARTEESKLVNNIVKFADTVTTNDLKSIEPESIRIFKAVGTFKEMRIPALGLDFKSRHLLDDFDYRSLESFEVDYFQLLIEISNSHITITGDQNIRFRKNKLTGEEKLLHNYISADGILQGEYAYLSFYNTQIEGIAIHRGTMILNLSDMNNIYGYLMTPDIELPGVIAMGRVEIKVVD